VVEKKTPTA